MLFRSTANSAHAQHWSKTAQQRKGWATATWVACAEQRIPRQLPPATLHTMFRFDVKRTRDPLNFADTLKPIVDYLVREHKCWPDDNPKYLTQLAPELSTGHKVDGVLLTAFARNDG